MPGQRNIIRSGEVYTNDNNGDIAVTPPSAFNAVMAAVDGYHLRFVSGKSLTPFFMVKLPQLSYIYRMVFLDVRGTLCNMGFNGLLASRLYHILITSA